MDMSKLSRSPIFQRGNVFAPKNPFSAASLGKGLQQAGNVLNQISSGMVAAENRQSELDSATRAQEIRRDMYAESDSSNVLEDMSTDLLEAALGLIRSEFYKSQRFEQGLTDFKGQLAQHDQAVQGYQDMRNGKTEIPDYLDRSAVELLHKSAQGLREQFLQKSIEQYNSQNKNYKLREEGTPGATSAILGSQKYSKMDESIWQIDASSSNIYDEIDRVLAVHREVSKTYGETIHQIHNELYRRGEKQYMRLEGTEWLEWEPAISHKRIISAYAIMEQLEKNFEVGVAT